jgi:acylphosphatase
VNESPNPPPIARRVHYSGRVQGVGFRATACQIARQFAVTGWVRNLSDDRVELWAEGAEAEVERFLRAIRDYWQSAIQREEVELQAATGQYDRFTIAR